MTVGSGSCDVQHQVGVKHHECLTHEAKFPESCQCAAFCIADLNVKQFRPRIWPNRLDRGQLCGTKLPSNPLPHKSVIGNAFSIRGFKGQELQALSDADLGPMSRSSRSETSSSFSCAILVRPIIKPAQMKYQRKNHGAMIAKAPIPRTMLKMAPNIPAFSSRTTTKMPNGIIGKKNQTHRVPNANRASKGTLRAALSVQASCRVNRRFIKLKNRSKRDPPWFSNTFNSIIQTRSLRTEIE